MYTLQKLVHLWQNLINPETYMQFSRETSDIAHNANLCTEKDFHFKITSQVFLILLQKNYNYFIS